MESAAGALSDARREQLKDIDPSWLPGLARGIAARLPPRPPPPRGRPPAASRTRRRPAPGRGTRPVGPLRPARALLGQADGGAAVDVRTRPRHHPRDRGREAPTAPYTRRQMATQPPGRQAVLPARGPPPRAEKALEQITVGEDQEEHELRLGAWVGNQRQPGRDAHARTGGAAVQDRHAMGVGTAVPAARMPSTPGRPYSEGRFVAI